MPPQPLNSPALPVFPPVRLKLALSRSMRVQVLGEGGAPLHLTASALDASPRDCNDVPGHSGDDRTLDNLLNGTNVTTDDRNMWLTPSATLAHAPLCVMTVTLGPAPVPITGLRLWNYNKGLDGTYRGVQCMSIKADGRSVTGAHAVLLPKAPGVDLYDYGHTIPLPWASSLAPTDAFDPGMALLADTPQPQATLAVRCPRCGLPDDQRLLVCSWRTSFTRVMPLWTLGHAQYQLAVRLQAGSRFTRGVTLFFLSPHCSALCAQLPCCAVTALCDHVRLQER